MSTTDWMSDKIEEVAVKLNACTTCELRSKSRDGKYSLPNRRTVHDVLDTLIALLFPGCHGHGLTADIPVDSPQAEKLQSIMVTLRYQVELAF